MAQFITTEKVGGPGEAAEEKVWEAVKRALPSRDCLVYWRYPIFGRQKFREPDILIADPEWGLVVIEVKGLRPEQILGIEGYRWRVTGYFGKDFINPVEQGRSQVQFLLTLLERFPELRSTPGRVLVALPEVSRDDWEARGFDGFLSEQPVLLSEDLTPTRLLRALERAPYIRYSDPLDDSQWAKLKAALGTSGSLPRAEKPVEAKEPVQAVSNTRPPTQPNRTPSRLEVLSESRAFVHAFDLQQESIAKTVPPGPQRIRGIAGSGKTVLLAQKAALMHLKHPEWRIALVFFSRSLYDQLKASVDHWLKHFSGGEVRLEGTGNRLEVLHAWGAREQPGFYRTLASTLGLPPLNVGNTPDGSPSSKLLYACHALLADAEQGKKRFELFDALLIDEGQDLVHEDEALRYKLKQAFYWMAYRSLKPVEEEQDPLLTALETTGTRTPRAVRRLIWAYDEAQSLDTLIIPQYKELFGEELGALLSSGVSYKGGIQKSEVMRKCYRTPRPILLAAHALGMGLLRAEGMLSGLTTAKGWADLGYSVEGQFRSGQSVSLHRPREHSPHPLEDLWKESLLEFKVYPDRGLELEALARKVSEAVGEGLSPSRQLLVLVLGEWGDAGVLQAQVFAALRRVGVSVYCPGNRDRDVLYQKYPLNDPNGFWREGAVTVSRVVQAKGNEADVVFIVGLDGVARNEAHLPLRNQLFVALSRSRGWVYLSGSGCADSSLTGEVQKVLESGETLNFIYKPPKRKIGDE